MKTLGLFYDVSMTPETDGYEFNPTQLTKALSAIGPGSNTIAKFTAAIQTASMEILKIMPVVVWQYKLGVKGSIAGIFLHAQLDPSPTERDVERIIALTERLLHHHCTQNLEQITLPVFAGLDDESGEHDVIERPAQGTTALFASRLDISFSAEISDELIDTYEGAACALANCKENMEKTRRFFTSNPVDMFIADNEQLPDNLTPNDFVRVPASQISEELAQPEYTTETIMGFEIGHEIPWALTKKGIGTLHIRRITDAKQDKLFDGLPPKTESVQIEVPKEIYEKAEYPALLKAANVERIALGIFDILSLKVKVYNGTRYVLEEMPTLLERQDGTPPL